MLFSATSWLHADAHSRQAKEGQSPILLHRWRTCSCEGWSSDACVPQRPGMWRADDSGPSFPCLFLPVWWWRDPEGPALPPSPSALMDGPWRLMLSFLHVSCLRRLAWSCADALCCSCFPYYCKKPGQYLAVHIQEPNRGWEHSRIYLKGVIGCKIHFSSCLNINVCWKCVYTSIL